MSSPTFTRSDTVTDSERFYNSVVDFLEDPDEQEVVGDLIVWWNQQGFSSSIEFLNNSTNDILTDKSFPRIHQPDAQLQKTVLWLTCERREPR